MSNHVAFSLECLESRCTPTVTLGAGWDGTVSPNWYPPDPQIAVGPTQVLYVVNEELAVYAKDTGALLQQQTLVDLFAGFPNGGGNIFDPQALYDVQAGRFVLTGSVRDQTNSKGYMLLTVSNSSDLLQGFSERQQFDLSRGQGLWPDFTKLGMNADGYYLSSDLFDPSATYSHPALTAITKASVLDQNSATVSYQITDWSAQTQEGYLALDVIPARMTGTRAGDPLFLLESNYLGGNTLEVIRADNPLQTNPTLTVTVLPVQPYVGTPAYEPGTFLQTSAAWFLNAEWNNGRLVGTLNASTVWSDGSGTVDATVAWYEFYTGGDLSPHAPHGRNRFVTPTLLQEGRIHPFDGVNTYMGAITVDATGKLGLVYTQSGGTNNYFAYPSVYVTGWRLGDPLGVMEAGILAHSGTVDIHLFRAGDYAGIALDPTDGSFWVAAEYGRENATWGVWIQNFDLVP